MKYRRFGDLDWKASALGFGCMRFPTFDGDRSNIDEPKAIEMLHYAIDHGVNYLDTAYPYHGGNSEILVGKALKGGYRDKVRLATKLPMWAVEGTGDFERYLNEQLEKLQVEHIDFYLFHGLRESRWAKVEEFDLLAEAEDALADGRIGHLGFSFHDDYEMFKEIVDSFDWTFCQIQHNFMDIDYQAGRKGLRYAASEGMAVVIMEPLLGGRLANPPDPVQAIWDEADADRSAVEWALQWLWNQPEVSVVLSGMSTLEHVKENVASADRSGAGALTEEELALFDRVREQYEELSPIPCTDCGYCMPCPTGLDIPKNFSIYNEGIMYDMLERARDRYENLSEGQRANHCIDCGGCQEQCPQDIPISEWMAVVHRTLGEGEPPVHELP